MVLTGRPFIEPCTQRFCPPKFMVSVRFQETGVEFHVMFAVEATVILLVLMFETSLIVSENVPLTLMNELLNI